MAEQRNRPNVPRAARGPWLAAIAVGVLLRAAALPFSGTGDVRVWKVWAYEAAVHGVAGMYGTGATPGSSPPYRLLKFGSLEAIADYPPLALEELGMAGRIYAWATGGRFPDSICLTMVIKGVPVLFEGLLCAALFVAARQTAGVSAARWATLAYWLNPAAIVSASFGGYLDALFVLPAVGAVMAATTGWPALAGGLIAAAALTKPQAIFVLPAVAVALWNTASPGARAARLTSAGAAAAIVTAAVVAPFVAAGAAWNVVRGVASQANEIYLSMEGYNVWWIAGHFLWVGYAWQRGLDAWSVFVSPVARIPFDRASAHGLPQLRAFGSVLALAGIGWGVWVGRKARDLSLVAAVAAFSVHAWATLGAQVHENHLFAAMPLLVVAAAGRRRFAPVLAGVSVFLTLSMIFYIFGDEEGRYVLSRSLTLVDSTLLLAVFGCAVFVWHAVVLRAEAGAEVHR